MSTTICGHELAALQQILTRLVGGAPLAWGPTENERRGVSFGPGHQVEDDALCKAAEAMHDPAELASIIAELMEKRGIPVCAAYGMVGEDHVHVAIPRWLELKLPQAHTFALRLLNEPTNQNIERMIEEVCHVNG